MAVIYRVLGKNDAEAYSVIRLKSLFEDGRYFAADPRAEASRTLDQWRLACAETCDKAVVGAFDGPSLVGIMAFNGWDRDQTGRTAHYRGGYVLGSYRHTDVAGRLYETLENTARERGFTSSVFAIRDDNTSWIKRQLDHGAEMFGEEPMRYADGTEARTVWLRKTLG